MPTIDNKEVGKRIKSIRTNSFEKKITLESFSKMIEPPVDSSSVRKWEKGLNLPNKERLKQIAKIGNVTTDYLLFGKQLSGYGERIKSIRENSLHESKLEFSYHFMKPSPVDEETITAWEDENLLPNYVQLEKLALLGNTSVSEILWNKKESPAVLGTKQLDEVFDSQRLTETQTTFRNDSISLFNSLRRILVESSNENLFNILSHILLLYGIEDLNSNLTTTELQQEREEILLIINKLLEDETLKFKYDS